MDNERLTKLHEALKLISEECASHSDCATCPFRTGSDNCKITSTNSRPDNWHILKEPIIPAPKLFG